MRILGVTPSPGTHLGQERLGSPAATMGPDLRKSEPAALFGHPAESNLGRRKPEPESVAATSHPKIRAPVVFQEGV